MINRIAQSNKKWEYAFVVYLSVLAILLTALANLTQVFLSGDSLIWYSPAVQALFNGAGYNSFVGDTFRGPLFPFVVYIAATIMGGRIFEAGLVVGVFSCLLFVTGVFLASRKAFDARLAFLLSLAVSLTPTILFNSVEWLTDLLFAAMCMFSLWMMYFDGKHSLLGPILAGGFGGLALMTRWNAFFLLIVVLFCLVLNPLMLTWRRRFLWLLIYSLVFFIIASPWFWINWQLHGSPLYNTTYQSGFHASLISEKIGQIKSLKDIVLVDPVFFITRYLRRLLWDGWSEVGTIIPLPLLLFVPAGIIVWLRLANRKNLLFMAYAFAFWGVAALTFFVPRFYISLLPALLAFPILFFLSNLLVDRPIGKNGPRLGILGVTLLLLGIGWYNYKGVSTEVRSIVAARLPQVADWLARA